MPSRASGPTELGASRDVLMQRFQSGAAQLFKNRISLCATIIRLHGIVGIDNVSAI